jgi:DNA mismatch repair ATPase MutS
MYRCKENIEFVKLYVKEKSIIFMDEIFNSTNPIEGISGAYSILKKLGSFEKCTVILSTHFQYLAKLHKDSIYQLSKFDCICDDKGISYNYKLSKGLSKQYVALDILKAHGFDESIIAEANVIKNKLLNL